jgi:hypothetical protein
MMGRSVVAAGEPMRLTLRTFLFYNQMPEGLIITPNGRPVQPRPIGQVMDDEPPMPMSSAPLQAESETAVPSAAGDV